MGRACQTRFDAPPNMSSKILRGTKPADIPVEQPDQEAGLRNQPETATTPGLTILAKLALLRTCRRQWIE